MTNKRAAHDLSGLAQILFSGKANPIYTAINNNKSITGKANLPPFLPMVKKGWLKNLPCHHLFHLISRGPERGSEKFCHFPDASIVCSQAGKKQNHMFKPTSLINKNECRIELQMPEFLKVNHNLKY